MRRYLAALLLFLLFAESLPSNQVSVTIPTTVAPAAPGAPTAQVN